MLSEVTCLFWINSALWISYVTFPAALNTQALSFLTTKITTEHKQNNYSALCIMLNCVLCMLHVIFYRMWQIGLTDTILTSMKNIISMCSKLRWIKQGTACMLLVPSELQSEVWVHLLLSSFSWFLHPLLINLWLHKSLTICIPLLKV